MNAVSESGGPASGEQPVIAAIVVNYRTPRLTIDCVESLLRSTGVAVRIFIIDNASGDESVSRLAARFGDTPSVSVHARDVNDGYTGGNNAGMDLVRETRAEYALVINSDAVVKADCLEIMAREMRREPRVALVCPRIHYGDPPDLLWFGGATFSFLSGRVEHVGHRLAASQGWQEPRDLPFASGCAVLIRLSACTPPLFDASLFGYAEDLDLSLTMREAGYRLRYIPAALVWHFEGGSHRDARGQGLRFYLSTRNQLRVVARHARWYHWPVLAPMLAVNIVGRFSAVAVRNRDWTALVATWRGALHAITGGRHPVETTVHPSAPR